MIKSFSQTAAYLFAVLGILFVPFPYHLFPWHSQLSNGLFGRLTQGIKTGILGWETGYHEITSDSSSLYVLMGLLLILAVMGAAGLMQWGYWKRQQTKFFHLFHSLICGYLALQMLNYGIDKVFKGQFYLPEPNLLYTPLGHLDKDILFWSSMGTSYGYNLFMGGIEVLAAGLLLFRRTRVLGLLIALGTLLNIVAINFGFDISVKVFSGFLLLLAILGLVPFGGKLAGFFLGTQAVQLRGEEAQFQWREHAIGKPVLKSVGIVLICLEVFLPVVSLNDDLADRPYLHGAYAVQEIVPMDSIADHPPEIKRLFVHREGYLIFQDEQDLMADYKLEMGVQTLTLTDYAMQQRQLKYSYSERDSLFTLQFFKQGQEYEIRSKAVDWRSLPLMQDLFHWTVD